MDDLLLVGKTGIGTNLYVSELSVRTLSDNGISGESNGLYLYETDDKANGYGIRVLASFPCLDSAYRMIDLLGERYVSA